MRSLPVPALLGAAALACAPSAFAQSSPFLPDAVHRHLVNEISGDRAFEYDRHLTHFHRTGGSRDFFAAAEFIRQAAEAAGLADVKLIRQKWEDGHSWSCRSGEAWLTAPEPLKLAAYGDVAVSIADHSRTTHLEAELVDVGAGVGEQDYAGKEVRGKVVLAAGALDKVTEHAVWKRGALGILSHATNREEALDAPDQVAWGRLPYEAKDVEGIENDTPSTFAVMISPRRGRWLQQQLAGGKPARVRVDIEAEIAEPAEQALVEGWIRGGEVPDQQVVLTSHIQEEMTSANDDGSGCGNMLEIARALVRLIAEGKLERPRRDIRFWWVNELDSQPRYFRDHPGEPRRMLINVNQDMVGARQSLGGRVQYASRLPWSLPHALDDVMESVLETVRDGNTALLSLRGTDRPAPFTRPILAVKGSREPFHARMVPYYDSTDHHAFTPAHVGVPATSLTNWPDDFIHSTGDDLEQVDATQLERNAVVAAAVALYFAGLREEDAPALAAYVEARGRARTALDRATAVAHLAQAAPAERAAAYRAARSLIHHSSLKERGAVGSVQRLAGGGRAAELVRRAIARLEAGEASDLEALEQAYAAIAGEAPPKAAAAPSGEEERRLAGRVYTPVADPAAFHDALEKAKPVTGFHRMMAFEVVNFADGRRSAHEIYQAVAAEALSAGHWYYGEVRPADVLETLERAAKAGAFTVEDGAGGPAGSAGP